jgi:hypothetical protein
VLVLTPLADGLRVDTSAGLVGRLRALVNDVAIALPLTSATNP